MLALSLHLSQITYNANSNHPHKSIIRNHLTEFYYTITINMDNLNFNSNLEARSSSIFRKLKSKLKDLHIKVRSSDVDFTRHDEYSSSICLLMDERAQQPSPDDASLSCSGDLLDLCSLPNATVVTNTSFHNQKSQHRVTNSTSKVSTVTPSGG